MERRSTQDTSGMDRQETAARTLHNDESNAADQPLEKRSRQYPSRAARLLQQAIDRELISAEALAYALGISSRQLEKYRTGRSRVPLHAQRRLAELLIGAVPELAREARRLQLQCKAAELFHAKETQIHMVAPPSRFR